MILQTFHWLLPLLPIISTHNKITCNRTKLCNGVMCDNVCVPGSVVLDPWMDKALAFQRELQRDEPLVRTTLIGTHNSAISQAYGFGIEQDFIGELLPHRKMYQGDDLGEGVCQSLSVLDQLRLGLRHIEIDINSGWFEEHYDEIFVCHSPFPLDPTLIVEVDETASAKGIVLGWEAKNLSCEGTKRSFRDGLEEIKKWLDENVDEIVVLYLDVKPLCIALPSQTSAAYKIMVDVFGDTIWSRKDGDPLVASRNEFLRRGKRVLFEDHDDGWNNPAHGEEVLVFTPDLFHLQFGENDISPYPNCSIGSTTFESWYPPVLNVSNKYWARGLGFGNAKDDVTGSMRCGVQILSPNYIQPADLEGYVWTVERNSSWSPESNACMAMLPSKRWGIASKHNEDCSILRPFACRNKYDDTVWVLGGNNNTLHCPEGFVAIPPTNGYANEKLAEVAAGRTVYLNVYPNGTLASFW